MYEQYVCVFRKASVSVRESVECVGMHLVQWYLRCNACYMVWCVICCERHHVHNAHTAFYVFVLMYTQ